MKRRAIALRIHLCFFICAARSFLCCSDKALNADADQPGAGMHAKRRAYLRANIRACGVNQPGKLGLHVRSKLRNASMCNCKMVGMLLGIVGRILQRSSQGAKRRSQSARLPSRRRTPVRARNGRCWN